MKKIVTTSEHIKNIIKVAVKDKDNEISDLRNEIKELRKQLGLIESYEDTSENRSCLLPEKLHSSKSV